MKLRFKKQKFQEDAVRSVCECFTGQQRLSRSYLVDTGTDADEFASIAPQGFGNATFSLPDAEILKNIREIQKQNGLPLSPELAKLNNAPCLTVEMETGTGKTYTYIKTMYELFTHYGWSKFIVVVPSIAIREGILKSFQITQEHFSELYGHRCRFFVYNSSRLNELDQFASDSKINVMIINTQAFNARGADARRIDMELDTFRGRKPIEVVAAVRPIVIIDEPQSVIGTDKSGNVTRASIKKFNPLFFINYSATHRENFNQVYRLDAIDAYQKQLVKKIFVKGITVVGNTASAGYVYVQKINTFPDKNPEAIITFDHTSPSGIRKKTAKLVQGDNLYDHSGEIESYQSGHTITEIDARCGVSFSGGFSVKEGEYRGEENEDDLRRIQIRETIATHLETERALFKKGIKVLSLFFIDEVAKYKTYADGNKETPELYWKLFEEEYAAQTENFLTELPFEEDKPFRDYLKESLSKVTEIHAGYFSIDKKGQAVNSTLKRGESDSDDISAYDLIMKNKERLLSVEEPVRFIFSHSALREGWDNPNVFQICTLREGVAEIRKRQEIGRGLRLCVDKTGERQDGELLGQDNVQQINKLTVIANESYEKFANALQDEMSEVLRNRPKAVNWKLFADTPIFDKEGKCEISANEKGNVLEKLKSSGLIENENLTAKYHNIPPERRADEIGKILGESQKPFVESIVRLLDSVYDPAVRAAMVSDARGTTKLRLNRERFNSKEFRELWRRINAKTYYTVSFKDEELIKNCVEALDKHLTVQTLKVSISTGVMDDDGIMKKTRTKQERITELVSKVRFDLIGEIAGKCDLTRAATAAILTRIRKETFDKFKANPEDFIVNVCKLIDAERATTIIQHITYNKLNQEWAADAVFVDNEITGVAGQNVADAKKHLYDKLRYDSDVEKKFGAEMDIDDIVEMYVKLPRGFHITTPLGKYNPDWAIVLKEKEIKHIYFVAESKGATLDIQLREVERAKIECARRHFAKISDGTVRYEVVDSYELLLKKLRQ